MMKTRFFAVTSLLLAVFLSVGCNSPKPDNTTNNKNDSEINDFNGDGIKDSCYLLGPKLIEEEMECDGDCVCLIMFSDGNIPPIEVPDCIDGRPVVFGDLDGNGTCELGIWPGWWTSCWHTFYIYTFVDGKWSYFVDPFSVHCNLMEELEETGESIIEPVPGTKDMFKIKYSEFDMEEGILAKTTTVKKN